MSRNYHTASESFYVNENRIKEIVQAELEDFFIGIKQEIESKIKQIDYSISDLKTEIRRLEIVGQKSSTSIGQMSTQFQVLSQKIEQIQKQKDGQMEKLIEEMRNKTFDRGYDRRQQKSPIFRKTNTAPSLDLNNLIFGQDSSKSNPNAQTVLKGQQQTKQNNYQKPPLPKIKQPQPKQSQQKLQSNPKNLQVPKYDPKNYPLISNSSISNSNMTPTSTFPLPNSNLSFTPSVSLTHIKQSMSLPSATQVPYSSSQSSSPYPCATIAGSHLQYQTRSQGQTPSQSSNGEQHPLQSQISHRLAQNLNKNKNSFMRKKNLKKFGTIHEEQVEQSMMSTT